MKAMSSKFSLIHYLTAGALLFSINAKAQNPVSAPSPETAVFSKNGNIPVSTYTGVPNVSVPLFTIKDGDITIPINLSYNASGIKVEEDAGWAGLGWSLNAGGQITRAIRGKDDFNFLYGVNYGYLSPETINAKPLFSGGAPMQGNPLGFYAQHTSTTTNLMFWGLDQSGNPFSEWILTTGGMHDFGNINNDNALYFDFQSDVFYFNAGGYSGKFVFDDTGKPMPLKKSKIKIEVINGSNFKITGEDGLIYTFDGVREQTTELIGTGYYYISAWYLTKIESPNGKNIVTFTYGGNLMTTNKLTTYRQSVDLNGNTTSFTDYSQSQINAAYLTEINYNGGKVKFESVKDRTDVTNAMRLSAVVITDKNNVEKKRYSLKTSYFHATAGPTALENDRLKLDKVTINGDENNAYVFDYNTDYIPSKNSGKDHWGYANNTGIGIPQGIYQLTKLLGGAPTTVYQFQPGADYEAHWPYTQAMNLKQITYPTKGYSRFVYEPNSFSNLSNYWQYDLVTPPPVNMISYPVSKVNNGSVTSSATLNGLYNLTGHFWVNNAAELFGIYIQFYDSNNQVLYTKTLSDFTTGDNHNFYLNLTNLPIWGTTVRCQVTATINNSYPVSTFLQFFSIQLDSAPVSTLTNSSRQEVQGGGLRIKEIINNDGGGETTFKQYDYKNDVNMTSGQIMNYPVYMNFVWQSNDVESTAANYSSRSTIGLSTSAGGNYVGYSQVKEIIGTANANTGSTVRYYTNLPDIIPYDTGIGLPTQRRADNGLLEKQINYDASNNKISELTNTYSSFDQFNWNSTTGAFITRYGLGDFKSYVNTVFYYYKEYQLDFKLLNTTEKLFNRNDISRYTQAFTEYQYKNNMSPRKVIRTTSAGIKDITEYRYADDYNTLSAPAFIARLQSSNILNKPVETVSLKVTPTDTTAYKGEINEYGAAPDQAGLLINQYSLYTSTPVSWPYSNFTNVLANSSSLNFDWRYALKNTYAYSNPRNQVTDYTSNGASSSYKWGYNNEYPVAICKNALSAEFYYEGFEDTPSASTGTGHTGIRYTTNPAISWTRPNARNYVISYWYYSAGWKYSGELPYASNSFTMTGGTAYDDIRIYPVDAQMTTFTYQALEGMKSMTDAKGVLTTYEYDGLQRLTDVKDQYGNIVKHNDYNYRP